MKFYSNGNQFLVKVLDILKATVTIVIEGVCILKLGPGLSACQKSNLRVIMSLRYFFRLCCCQVAGCQLNRCLPASSRLAP